MKRKSSFDSILVLIALAIVIVFGPSAQKVNAQPQSASTGALPAEIDPDSACGELVRMVQAGVEQGVVLAYIDNSLRLFNLDADRIIYLTDLGAPAEIIEAAMAHDRKLIDDGISSAAPDADEGEESIGEQPEEVTMDDFRHELAPYGVWVEVDGYGRCWRPTVLIYNSSWRPYCDNGRWVYTDCGWYWVSNYSWGWRTSHYGRWFQHSRYGWCWWPDTVWAPSWVCWRYERDYCGWAPLPPYTTCLSGVGFVYRGSTVGVGFDFGLGVGSFTFIATKDFCDPEPWRHRIGKEKAAKIYNRTKVFHEIKYDKKQRRVVNSGISSRDIAAITQKEIRPVSIRHEKEGKGRGNRHERLDREKRTLFVSSPNASSASSARDATSIKTRQKNRVPEHRSGSRSSGQSVSRSVSKPSRHQPAENVAPKTKPRRPATTAPRTGTNKPSKKQVQKSSRHSSPPPEVAPQRKPRKPAPQPKPKKPAPPKSKKSNGRAEERQNNK
ncbi:MAG: DUF6600 domain-containing protein [Verrucomicrobiota bacterium]